MRLRSFYQQHVSCKNGFTIVEVIVIIAVIGILCGVVLTSWTSSQNRAKREQAVGIAEQVKLQLSSYFNEKNRYPATTATVTAYLSSKGQASLAAAIGDTAQYTYTSTKADGSACSDTGQNKCERYVITVNKTIWNGNAADTNVEIAP